MVGDDVEHFAEFHEWLMADVEKGRSVDEMIQFAGTLGDLEVLREAVRHERVAKMLSGNHGVWYGTGKSVPIAFIKGRKITGIPDSLDDFFHQLDPLVNDVE